MVSVSPDNEVEVTQKVSELRQVKKNVHGFTRVAAIFPCFSMRTYPMMFTVASQGPFMGVVDMSNWEAVSKICLFKEKIELVGAFCHQSAILVYDKTNAKCPSFKIIKFALE